MSDGSFRMTVLGRTIEHLGTQMYKHRAPSIAELVANCWDAGAKECWLTVPTAAEYDPGASVISVKDSGDGMSENTVQDHYMVVGRNRRETDHGMVHNRKVMGRKGIGKLAGFGLATKVTVTTWTAAQPKGLRFSMQLDQFRVAAGKADDIVFPWSQVDKPANSAPHGTEVELSQLRHGSPLDLDALAETLTRRFSRITRREMKIYLNGSPLPEPTIDWLFQTEGDDGFLEAEIAEGKTVRYKYGFAKSPLRSKELQGFVVYANERTAQAPPFFFNVESTASSQHSTRYVSGEIVADYIDTGTDSESDLISTDRQEVDWEKEELKELKAWGEKLTRKILRDCGEMMGEELENWVIADSEFGARLDRLDTPTKKQIRGFLKVLGQQSAKNEPRTRELAESLIRAYEFRMFHDVIDHIEEVSTDPAKLAETLGRLHDWKVLESRAILEIVKGRLSVVNKLEAMILDNAPETASKITHDNLHDLLAGYPWLFNPEWQVFVEEKSIGRQLREWGQQDVPQDMADKRVDFLAFEKDAEDIVIVELKRPGHAVTFDEIQRLERYQVALMATRPRCRRVLVYGGTLTVPKTKLPGLEKDPDLQLLPWSEMFHRARKFYAHYAAVLNGDVSDPAFSQKQKEVVATRRLLEMGTAHRSREQRKEGLGNQDP
ncbi:hypothetical protein Pan44_26600 [Caulifigura coniformis]|uniref:DNA mismatch repair protein n=1 Tax=Caulifigura coniformis TaxID=2527983 RepID=A0A517SES1_9PLAN|nr:ATP-binding protein [Caulifigura coniformis]QDT54625.1 hypothetical protein Pan44_26600 [Caulifigura coniformis]